MLSELLTVLAGIVGGVIASVTGFGVGSVLTPLASHLMGVKLAVAVVSIPHCLATTMRFWQLRHEVDRHVLWTFGMMNAVGGLVGALFYEFAKAAVIRVVFGSLLIFAGVMGLTGLASRIRFGRRTAWFAGMISGGLGGFSGTQGGIRAAALFGFDLSKSAFVATSTAIGLIVDGSRMPVYLVTEWEGISTAWRPIAAASVGVVLGTLLGRRVLQLIPERVFRTVVSVLILVLGAAMIVLIRSEPE